MDHKKLALYVKFNHRIKSVEDIQQVRIFISELKDKSDRISLLDFGLEYNEVTQEVERRF